MGDYNVFGGHLRSELEFPELARCDGSAQATWTLRRATGSPPTGDLELLGTASIGDDVGVRLFRTLAGYRLEYDDTGTYEVRGSGSEIVWYPAPGTSLESVRLDILGRVLALAFHASGAFSLHASAVALGGGAVGFMAPKLHGKSTTAFALVRSGARLVTDDMLVISSAATPRVRPGIQTVRLWEDSAAAVDAGGGARVGEEGKVLVDDLHGSERVQETLPLSALYLLAPFVDDGAGRPVGRTRLPPTTAAVLLVAHAKIGSLLGGSEAPVLFGRAAALAARVPVYRLEVPRDFKRLHEVVAEIRESHAGEAAAAVAGMEMAVRGGVS